MGSRSVISRLSRVFAASQAVQRPAVGVGVVVFNNNNQVLLIRRGKAPSKGMISFPGGRQELGETVIECAIREAKEECGIDLRHDPRLLRNVERIGATRVPRAYLQSRTLEHPIPFTAVDVMSMSEEDARETELEKMLYHYAIIEVAAMVADPSQVPVAADDADEAFWWDCDEFLTSDNPDIVPNLKHVVETVLSTFDFT
jgi:ADP-ribose pyrophosphatase YjhB (NUDIX family)